VFEHLAEPAAAIRELARVCRDGAVVTVPRLPDDNPEHLRLHDTASLRALLTDGGFETVRIEAVDIRRLAMVRLRR
jgi:hypothetical protein